MPKIVQSGTVWKAAELPGECCNDANFAFLSSFEECSSQFEEFDGRIRPIYANKSRKRKKIKTETDKVVQKKRNKCQQESLNVVNIESGVETSGDAGHGFEEIDLQTNDSKKWQSLNLSNEVLKAIRDSGFLYPTEIQQLVIPSAIRDHSDIIGAAETGSGKTLAFVIPIVERLINIRQRNDSFECSSTTNGITALVLAPTRELVMQIKKQFDSMAKYTDLRSAVVVGGLSQQKQERVLGYKPDILIATPGRLLAMISIKEFVWKNLKFLVIDEADRMVDGGHLETVQRIFAKLKSNPLPKLQTLIFSATLTFVHNATKSGDKSSLTGEQENKIDRLINITGIRKAHKIVDITKEKGIAELVIEARINCENLLEKDTSVVYLLHQFPGRTLIFTNSIDASRRLHGILSRLEWSPKPFILHAKMLQKKRLLNLEKFAAQENAVLLATDVAARGLDIRNVEHVIHYQAPKTAELYIHRCGRTARATRSGLAILLVDPDDVKFYHRICRNLGKDKELPIFPVDSSATFAALRDRVEAATILESTEHRLKKIQLRNSWFEKAAESADIELETIGEEDSKTKGLCSELQRQKKKFAMNLKYLLTSGLPKSSDNRTKSRYVTAEILANHANPTSTNAIASLLAKDEYEQILRKKCRTIPAQYVQNLMRKKRRKVKRK